MGCEEYLSSLKEYCTVAKKNDFPQLRPSDFLGTTITIQDMYVPVRFKERAIFWDIHSSGYGDSYLRTTAENENIISLNNRRYREMEEENSCQKTRLKKFMYKTAVKDFFRRKLCGFPEPDFFCIQSVPGGGKTMLTKMLIWALLEQDKEFLDSVNEQTGMKFSENALPIFIDFRNLNENLSEMKMLLEQDVEFEKILYQLAGCTLEESIWEICEFEDFSSMLHDKTRPAILFLDGWSEICDLELKEMLEQRIDWYLLAENRMCSVFLTKRIIDFAPAFLQRRVDTPLIERPVCLEICPLDQEQITEFCRIYYENVYKNVKEKMLSYKDVADHIMERFAGKQIINLSDNPCTLSILLLMTRDGQLSYNYAQIYEEFLDIYLGWVVQKNEGIRRKKDMLVLLAYLAWKCETPEHAVSRSVDYDFGAGSCTEQEILAAIQDCVDNFPGTFENVTKEQIPIIMNQIESTVLERMTIDVYRFIDTNMQEYLMAYALIHQCYIGEEYGGMSTMEILRSNYGQPAWHPIIIFAALMQSGIRETLLRDLMYRVKNTDLLFGILENDVPMKKADENRIYDLLFSDNYVWETQEQFFCIALDIRKKGKRYEDFKTYISDHFSASIDNGHSKYGFSMAVIRTFDLLEQGKHPLEEAEQYIIGGSDMEKILGFHMLAMFGHVKSNEWHYVINEDLDVFYSISYTPSVSLLSMVQKLLLQKFRLDDIAPCTAICMAADLFSFQSVVDQNLFDQLFMDWNDDSDSNSYSEILLSMAPINIPYHIKGKYNPKLHDKYEQKLEEELRNYDFDHAIFTYKLLLLSESADDDHCRKKEKWEEVDDLCEGGILVWDGLAKNVYERTRTIYHDE